MRTAIIILLVLGPTAAGCNEDSGISPTGSPGIDTSDSSPADAAAGPIAAAAVTVDPLPPPFDGANAQAVLEELAATLSTLSGVPGALADMNERLETLENAVTPRPVTVAASDVGFDDSKTVHTGGTVQEFSEALDTAVAGLDAALSSLEDWSATVDEALASQASARAAAESTVEQLGKQLLKQSWSGGIVIESSPAAPKPIFDHLVFGSNLTVHDGLWILWSHLSAVQQWSDTLMSAPVCPPDMTTLLPNTWICVDKARSGPITWAGAAENCHFAGKRLCRPGEFVHYCDYSFKLDPISDAPNKGIPDPEWVEGVQGTTEPLVAALFGAECDQMVTHPMKLKIQIGTSEHYRCCRDPHPDLTPLPPAAPLPTDEWSQP